MAKGTLFGKPIGQVIKRPGSFSKKAKARGMSAKAFASAIMSKRIKASTRTKRQASLARTMMSWKH